ncbi:MAG: hypothetical protein HY908_02065 [Myxococcales bacterium]|nr:hypothetical protein [Myxococcales bacterium]
MTAADKRVTRAEIEAAMHEAAQVAHELGSAISWGGSTDPARSGARERLDAAERKVAELRARYERERAAALAARGAAPGSWAEYNPAAEDAAKVTEVWELHRVATGAGPHDSPDATAALLGTYPSQDAAERAARGLPAGWYQVCRPGGQGVEVRHEPA